MADNAVGNLLPFDWRCKCSDVFGFDSGSRDLVRNPHFARQVPSSTIMPFQARAYLAYHGTADLTDD